MPVEVANQRKCRIERWKPVDDRFSYYGRNLCYLFRGLVRRVSWYCMRLHF